MGLQGPKLQIALEVGTYLPPWGHWVGPEWFLDTVIKSHEEVGCQ